MASTSDGEGGRTDTGVSTQLTTLVPTFDPSKDSLQIYKQKVELLLAAWPEDENHRAGDEAHPQLPGQCILQTPVAPGRAHGER